MDAIVKAEPGTPRPAAAARPPDPAAVIDLSSSSSSSDSDSGDDAGPPGKRPRAPSGAEDAGWGLPKRPKSEVTCVLPLGFLDPLPLTYPPPLSEPMPVAIIPPSSSSPAATVAQGCKQFWKAGDYEGGPAASSASTSGGKLLAETAFALISCVPHPLLFKLTMLTAVGMDHVRVHPKFLHSNATSHKWALGALAELLDNSLDEVCNGATYVNIDMLVNKKDGSRMLLVEDNGGGMDPDKMRQCMSLGYSIKSKIANTIGQYGNGFKTSTMRLGADVIVFSRSPGKERRSPTQSIGMLSYTFLTNTGKEDIVVPMLDYAKTGQVWDKMSRASSVDWNVNLETIVQWSPYTSESDLLQQFSSMADRGTRVVIYNLWEDDQGELELDFDSDEHDIQVRGVNRDAQKIEMAKKFPNSRHFLTYQHSLRSYASILYLRLPHIFRIILRGKDIDHHNIVTDMMLKQEVTYRPTGADGIPKDPNMIAVVTIGFVKDAKDHIDVQGFNVYHKNRLIKPFWRVWNAAGSDGRGVIGVLEANFVEPAHDKQGFERTTVLARLETRLVQMQKRYWTDNCHKIGYAPRRHKKQNEPEDRESSPDSYQPPSLRSKKNASPNFKTGKTMASAKTGDFKGGHFSSSRDSRTKSANKFGKTKVRSHGMTDSSDESDHVTEPTRTARFGNETAGSKAPLVQESFHKKSGNPPLSTPLCSVNNGSEEYRTSDESLGINHIATRLQSKVPAVTSIGNGSILTDSQIIIKQLKDENEAMKDRITKMEESMMQKLQHERDKNKSLTDELQEAQRKLEGANKEQEALIDVFSEERSRRNREEENLRKKLKDASATIEDLLEKLSASRSNQKPDQ